MAPEQMGCGMKKKVSKNVDFSLSGATTIITDNIY